MKRNLNFILILFLLAPFSVSAFQSVHPDAFKGPIRRFFEKVWECKVNIDCYRGKLGAFVQLASSDTLSAFPTTYNNNLAITLETGTTSVASITTLSGLTTANALTSATALVSVGTLTTGALGSGFTAVTVSLGGTGSTTLSANQILLGNGTTQLKVVSGLGTSGQFLQSAGAGLPPIWATSAVDEAANYTWTGTNSWSGQSTFASSSASTSVMSYWVATSTTGTSTANNGINLLGGCYAKNGVCAPTISTSSASSGLATGDSTETTVTPTCSSGKAISGGYDFQGNADIHQSSGFYSIKENIKITDTAWRIVASCVIGGGCPTGTLIGNVTCMSY